MERYQLTSCWRVSTMVVAIEHCEGSTRIYLIQHRHKDASPRVVSS